MVARSSASQPGTHTSRCLRCLGGRLLLRCPVRALLDRPPAVALVVTGEPVDVVGECFTDAWAGEGQQVEQDPVVAAVALTDPAVEGQQELFEVGDVVLGDRADVAARTATPGADPGIGGAL